MHRETFEWLLIGAGIIFVFAVLILNNAPMTATGNTMRLEEFDFGMYWQIVIPAVIVASCLVILYYISPLYKPEEVKPCKKE